MLDGLAIAHVDGRWTRLLVNWARIDDLALRPLTPAQAADLLEVIEDRSQRRSTIVTSQLPIANWHEALGDPTLADAILDRLSHNAHRIELRGDSLRRSDNRDQLISAAPTASEAPPPTPDPARPENALLGGPQRHAS